MTLSCTQPRLRFPGQALMPLAVNPKRFDKEAVHHGDSRGDGKPNTSQASQEHAST